MSTLWNIVSWTIFLAGLVGAFNLGRIVGKHRAEQEALKSYIDKIEEAIKESNQRDRELRSLREDYLRLKVFLDHYEEQCCGNLRG